MLWFGKKEKEVENIQIQPPTSSRVEIELDKNANKEAKKAAIKTNQQLKELLVENGFTVKIYLATGGTKPKARGK